MTGSFHLTFAYLIGSSVDVNIDDDHDNERQVEGAHGRVDLIAQVGRVGARVVLG